MDQNERIVTWANANKKKIAREYFANVEYKSHEVPAAIYMAGVPAAGKTEWANRLIPQFENRPLHIDMDEIATHMDDYKPKISHLFRAGATIILEKLYDIAINKKVDLLLDGTFGHDKVVQNIERALSRGYLVRVYFIATDPLVAWESAAAREKVEERRIDSVEFTETYYRILGNLKKVKETFGDAVPFSVVLKDSDNRIKDVIENVDIDHYINPVLTIDELVAKL